MPRPRRSVAALCIAVVALGAFLPGLWALGPLWLEPVWAWLPEQVPVGTAAALRAPREQSLDLRTLPDSRGPPRFSS